MYRRGKKLSKPKTQNKIRNPFILKRRTKEDRIIGDILRFLETEEEKKERKKLEKRKKLITD